MISLRGTSTVGNRMVGDAGGAAEFKRNLSSSTAADVYDGGEGGEREGQRSQRRGSGV